MGQLLLHSPIPMGQLLLSAATSYIVTLRGPALMGQLLLHGPRHSGPATAPLALL